MFTQATMIGSSEAKVWVDPEALDPCKLLRIRADRYDVVG